MEEKKYNELFFEFSTIGNELDELSLFFLKKIEEEGRVSHRPNVQWSGVVGAIQESREEKKRIAFLNEPLYRGMSYCKIAFLIMDKIDELVEKALVLQKLKTKDDIEYIAVGKLAFDYATNAAFAWYNYAPDAAELPITIGDQKDVGLWISVKSEVEEQLLRLDLSEELKKQLLLNKNDNDGNTGCLGVFTLFIVSVSSILWALMA